MGSSGVGAFCRCARLACAASLYCARQWRFRPLDQRVEILPVEKGTAFRKTYGVNGSPPHHRVKRSSADVQILANLGNREHAALYLFGHSLQSYWVRRLMATGFFPRLHIYVDITVYTSTI